MHTPSVKPPLSTATTGFQYKARRRALPRAKPDGHHSEREWKDIADALRNRTILALMIGVGLMLLTGMALPALLQSCRT